MLGAVRFASDASHRVFVEPDRVSVEPDSQIVGHRLEVVSLLGLFLLGLPLLRGEGFLQKRNSRGVSESAAA